MHRNTAIVIAFLAVVAALVMGLKIGQKLNGAPAQTLIPSPSTILIATSPAPTDTIYIHPACQIKLTYPADMQLTEASDSAVLVPIAATDPTKERIVLLCGADFPKPPLPANKIEKTVVASQSAIIYHDSSAKDGSPVDVVVFTHPKTHKEIALFGFGDIFRKILETVTLVP